MKVHYFVAGPNDCGRDNISELMIAFGSKHPKHSLPLEGCYGSKYVFCLDTNLDTIINICDTFDFEISGLYEDTPMFRRNAFFAAEVDPAHYNPNYRASCNYNGKTYVLSPIVI